MGLFEDVKDAAPAPNDWNGWAGILYVLLIVMVFAVWNFMAITSHSRLTRAHLENLGERIEAIEVDR